jgi:sensor histidine kinase regulating citrate/malate metabolism
MKREVQLQLFQRSFSTKGNNRGLGTYSMKLLGEQYLNGRVDFESSTQTGTTFSVELDLQGQSIFRH